MQLHSKKRRSVAVVVGLATAVLFAFTHSVEASTLTLGLDIEFSGPGPGVTPPAGPTPWVTATFDDSFGGPNTVRLTMSATNLTGSESLALITFNFDPLLDPTLLAFSVVDNAAAIPNSINTGVNAFMSDGDGDFDIQFDFPPPPGSTKKRFTGGETVIYDITYISAITASSFDFFSDMGGGQGTFLAAAHIQRTGGGSDSAWIGVVPEPGTAGLVGFGVIRRKPRRT